MKNLQDLFDLYILTKPSAGKIKTATSMMIHICKALGLSSQEEITVDYFNEIPQVLDDHFINIPLKSTLDKAILAEMIGRAGPEKCLKGMLDKLLEDKDENVRQYTLHSLEFQSYTNPEILLSYIERYRKSTDTMMMTMAAYLAAKVSCSEKYQIILDKIEEWYDQGDLYFVQHIIKRMIQFREQSEYENTKMTLEEIKEWSYKYCSEVADILFQTHDYKENEV